LENTTNNNAIEIFANAAREVRDLDIPSKQAVEALTRSALRMVALDLSNNNIQGAIDTKEKLQAVENYIKAKVGQQQADLITQNVVAAGRLRIIREVGKWLIDNIPHEGGQPKKEPLPRVTVLTSDLGISRKTSDTWQQVAELPDDEFEAWLQPYLDGNVSKGEELYFSRLLKHVQPPKEPSDSTSNGAPLSMQPHINAVYCWARDGVNVLQTYVEEVGKGETPQRQIAFVIEQLSSLQKEIETAKRQSGELY
jgi:hypothetical protein